MDGFSLVSDWKKGSVSEGSEGNERKYGKRVRTRIRDSLFLGVDKNMEPVGPAWDAQVIIDYADRNEIELLQIYELGAGADTLFFKNLKEEERHASLEAKARERQAKQEVIELQNAELFKLLGDE